MVGLQSLLITYNYALILSINLYFDNYTKLLGGQQKATGDDNVYDEQGRIRDSITLL